MIPFVPFTLLYLAIFKLSEKFPRTDRQTDRPTNLGIEAPPRSLKIRIREQKQNTKQAEQSSAKAGAQMKIMFGVYV